MIDVNTAIVAHVIICLITILFVISQAKERNSSNNGLEFKNKSRIVNEDYVIKKITGIMCFIFIISSILIFKITSAHASEIKDFKKLNIKESKNVKENQTSVNSGILDSE